MHLPQPTLLREGRVLEVIRLNHKVCCDVVADHSEPVALFVRELFPSALLLSQPSFEAGIDLLGKWSQLAVLVYGETDEGNQIGENTLAAGSFDLRLLLQRGVGLPELGFIPEIGRLLDGAGELLDVLELEPLFVGLAVEDLQGGDLVFVLCDELFERLHDGAGSR